MLVIEGLEITKRKEPTTGHQTFKCSNLSCERYFTKPLKAVNLRSEESKPYLACPFCLTGVNAEEAAPPVRVNPSQISTEIADEPVSIGDGKMVEHASNSKCAYHYGYLSERSTRERIPEECMVCENVLNCMNKKAKS